MVAISSNSNTWLNIFSFIVIKFMIVYFIIIEKFEIKLGKHTN